MRERGKECVCVCVGTNTNSDDNRGGLDNNIRNLQEKTTN